MTQRELERELAQLTGESVTTIRNMGFSLVEPPELEPLVVDWDSMEADRVGLYPPARSARRLVA